MRNQLCQLVSMFTVSSLQLRCRFYRLSDFKRKRDHASQFSLAFLNKARDVLSSSYGRLWNQPLYIFVFPATVLLFDLKHGNLARPENNHCCVVSFCLGSIYCHLSQSFKPSCRTSMLLNYHGRPVFQKRYNVTVVKHCKRCKYFPFRNFYRHISQLYTNNNSVINHLVGTD